jgi:hypothetical protein
MDREMVIWYTANPKKKQLAVGGWVNHQFLVYVSLGMYINIEAGQVCAEKYLAEALKQFILEFSDVKMNVRPTPKEFT